MRGVDKRKAMELGASPALGPQAQEALRAALEAAEVFREDATASVLGGEEGREASIAALRAPAAMARDALARSWPESASSEIADGLTRELLAFDWGAWRAGLRATEVVYPDAEAIETTLFWLLDEAFHEMEMGRASAAGFKNSRTLEAAQKDGALNPPAGAAAKAFEEKSAPRIELARKMFAAMSGQDWGGSEYSNVKFDRQRVAEGFLQSEGWPWSHAREIAAEAAGLWSAVDFSRRSSMRGLWMDRAHSIWPCLSERANQALLSMCFAQENRDPAWMVASLLARAPGVKDLDEAFAEIKSAMAAGSQEEPLETQAFWARALAGLANSGHASGVEWGVESAQKAGFAGEALREAIIPGFRASGDTHPESSREGAGGRLSVGVYSAAAKWLRPDRKVGGPRGEKETERGLRAFGAV